MGWRNLDASSVCRLHPVSMSVAVPNSVPIVAMVLRMVPSSCLDRDGADGRDSERRASASRA
jgi:hypothetical protein